MKDENRIGDRMRERREAQGMSLRELARRTDLTASFLSQVEHGQSNTSIGSLRRIAGALGVSILYLLEEGPRQDPVVRADKRPRITVPDSDVVLEMLTADVARKLEVFLAVLRPGACSIPRPLLQPTEECIVVLAGALLVGLDTGEYTLHPGDSICFEGHQLRKVASASEEETRLFSIITPPVF